MPQVSGAKGRAKFCAFFVMRGMAGPIHSEPSELVLSANFSPMWRKAHSAEQTCKFKEL
jgi:hypothetical protein